MWRIMTKLQNTNIFTEVNFLTDQNERFYVILHFSQQYVSSSLTYMITKRLFHTKISLFKGEQCLKIVGQ